ncbi:MAG: aminopeptidase [Planctomycetaceae bacterium]|nr:aminopeptidase [Planctomycetaceae bacterium]
MKDLRIDKLAETLLDHSCRLQPGERVLIDAYDLPDPYLVCRLVEMAAERGAVPFVNWKSNTVLRSLFRTATEEGMALAGKLDLEQMKQMQAYIAIRGAANSSELADVPGEKLDLYQKHWWKPVTDHRINHSKWVVLRYPTSAMAQSAKMSTVAFEEFFYSVCTADYAQMERNQQPLQRLMEATDIVRIVGPGTDLTFSIKDIPVIACNGGRNIPDGEVFTAPVRNSVNGTIAYNTPSLYQGTVFEGIRFQLENGRIVNAECRNETQRLNAILDSDEGSRYIGEWSLGCNNLIRKPMLDTLFDEKIGGSLHFTPGQAYETADNGNRSRVHWDLVLIQTPEYGGGEIYFDGKLIRKDGRFLPDDLQPLNEGLAAT